VADALKVEIRRWLRASAVAGVQTAKNAYLLDVGQFIRGRWRAGVRKRTRGLQNSILRSGVEPSPTAKTTTVRVYSTLPDRARWDSEGTGIYGPRKQVIRPKRARVLAWPTGSGGGPRIARRSASKRAQGGKPTGYAFARFVRGAPGTKAFPNAQAGPETKAFEQMRRAQMEREMKAALERSVR